jgi:tetratricopeptide (TPR) repeat protein
MAAAPFRSASSSRSPSSSSRSSARSTADLLRQAVAAQQEGNQTHALDLLLRAIDASPGDWVAHTCLGGTLRALGRLEEAIAIHRRAVELGGDHRAMSNLALAYREAGRVDEAIAAQTAAVARAPGEAELHGNLAGLLLAADRPAEAEEAARRALAINPTARFETNLGYARKEQGDFAGAAAHLRRAIARDPEDADAHWNLGLTLLAAPASPADEAEGWAEIEWRQRIRGLGIPAAGESAAIPRWAGDPLAGRTLLLQAEQGLGDTLQFARYARLAKALAGAGRTILECQAPLERLLRGCDGVDTVVARGAALPPVDVRAGLFSLPGFLGGRTPGGGPAAAYLTAEPARVARWRALLATRTAGATFRIGVAWQGNRRYRADGRRSIPLGQFVPLFSAVSAAGGAIVSLQKGEGREQLLGLPAGISVEDLGPELDADGAFVDTAALMATLDLVITSDTAIPHLAGALGLPVWMALAHLPDWRWGLAGEACAWYPTMRLFRQSEPGDWPGVVVRIARAVDERFAAGTPVGGAP